MAIQTKDVKIEISDSRNQPSNMAPMPNDFWKTKTIEELAAEQGVKPMTDWNQYFGSAKDLWDSDEDFEEFLLAVRGLSSERS